MILATHMMLSPASRRINGAPRATRIDLGQFRGADLGQFRGADLGQFRGAAIPKADADGLSPAGTMLDVPAMSETTTLPPVAVVFAPDHARRPSIGTNFDGRCHAVRVGRLGRAGKVAA
jgi:hypothetical protein